MNEKESIKRELLEKWFLLHNAGNTVKQVKLILCEIEHLIEQLSGKNSIEFRQFEKAKTEYEKATGSPLNFALVIATPDIFLDDFRKKFEPIVKRLTQNKTDHIIGDDDMLKNKKPLIQIFDSLHLHPQVVRASRSLFADGHYEDAIFRAYVELNSHVKSKSGLSPQELKGLVDSKLMAKVFDESSPIIKINSLIDETDINEQAGFKFLFMGATIGIRNKKAHENITQNDPYRTLEYLGLASLLIKITDEGVLNKPITHRPKWNWDKFLADIQKRCNPQVVDLATKLHAFVESKADELSWGTGKKDGSFTLKKLGGGKLVSILTMYSYGYIYINFDSMKNKQIPNETMETLRTNLNKIPNIVVSKEAVNDGYPRIQEKPLTNSANLAVFTDAIASFCEGLDAIRGSIL